MECKTSHLKKKEHHKIKMKGGCTLKRVGLWLVKFRVHTVYVQRFPGVRHLHLSPGGVSGMSLKSSLHFYSIAVKVDSNSDTNIIHTWYFTLPCVVTVSLHFREILALKLLMLGFCQKIVPSPLEIHLATALSKTWKNIVLKTSDYGFFLKTL